MSKGVSTTDPDAALRRALVAVQRARVDISSVVLTLRDGRLTAERQQIINGARTIRSYLADFEEMIRSEIKNR